MANISRFSIQMTEKRQRLLLVRKRNGKLESLDVKKMTTAISRAGTPFIMARDIGKSINDNLLSGDNDSVKENESVNSDGNIVIASSRLTELVTAELEKRNQPTIAESYSGHTKKNMKAAREGPPGADRLRSKPLLGMNTHAKQFTKDKDNTSGRGSKTGYQE